MRSTTQRRVLSATDADGDETDHFATDGQGNVVSGYNLAGQPLATVLPATGQQGAGRSYTVTSYLYPGGPATGSALYDEGGSLIRQVGTAYGPAGETLASAGTTQSVGYTYDALYRLTSITDGNGHTTRYTYSPAGYLTGVAYPGASGTTGYDTTTSTYDAAGYLTKTVDGRGVEADYGYDASGSLSSVQYPASSAQNVGYSDDAYGRTACISDGSGSRSFAYDDGDRLTGVQTQYTGLPAEAVAYAYYPDGSRSSMTTPGGGFSYGYDSAGRLASLTNPFGETTGWGYRPNGWLAQQTLGNGVQTVYQQDPLGRLARLTNQTTGGNGVAPAVLSDFTIPSQGGYDGAGDRLGVTATLPAAPSSFSGSTAYAYDPLGRLTGEQSQRNNGYTSAFGMDGGGATGAGDLTTLRGTSHSYNADNQDTANAYDGAGNPTTYGGQSLSFDAESRMTSFGGVETNGYRSDGLRAVKQSSAGTTYFLYDGDDPVCELNASGSVTAVNTFGGAGLLSRHTAAGSTFYTFDERGDVAQRLDATGAPLSTDLYDAYGAKVSTAATQPDPFGFAAQGGCYTDAETGLVLCGHRYYDPAAGRFLNRDPAGQAGGLDLYAYCGGNPVTQDDPSGFNPQHDGGDGGEPGAEYGDGHSGEWPDYLKRLSDRYLGGGPPSIPGVFTNPLDVLRGLGDTPSNIEHLGGPTGDFAGSPSWQKVPGVIQDVSTAATVITAGAGAASGAGADGIEEDIQASTPVGRRGSPMDVPRGTNEPGSVNGIEYTGHAFDQMQGRGITPSMVEEALQNGTTKPGYDGATIYRTQGLKVVVNPNGSIKTVVPQSSTAP